MLMDEHMRRTDAAYGLCARPGRAASATEPHGVAVGFTRCGFRARGSICFHARPGEAGRQKKVFPTTPAQAETAQDTCPEPAKNENGMKGIPLSRNPHRVK